MDDPQFVLKTTPPRAHRQALVRPRLAQTFAEVGDRAVIEVQAAPGFGKTTLLVQWRRLWLERGTLVAWVSLDAADEPVRFAHVLLHALREASGRASFTALTRQLTTQDEREHDVLTGLLAEVAALAAPTVLILDDAERLPAASVTNSLAYLMVNAPPNLQVVIGTRTSLDLPTWDLASHGGVALLKTTDLRLGLDEATALLHRRFGARLTLHDCARLHEITEGWPLGLALAASAIEREADLATAVRGLSARGGDLERYFIENLLVHLPPRIGDFLTRIAILDDLVPELCEVVTGSASAAADLDQLTAQTPIFVAAELRGWVRMHLLARDFLLSRFEQLPADERTRLHRRAAEWFSARERYHEAASHAFAAGDEVLANAYAERALWTLATLGRLTEAREWIERLPPAHIDADVDLRLVAAWIMALGDRPAEALHIARQVGNDAAATTAQRIIAALVGACAAIFADRIGEVEAILAPWPEETTRLGDPVHAAAYANTLAAIALHGGQSERARRLVRHAQGEAASESMRLAHALGRSLIGLSHLWDGDAVRAEGAMREALAQAERLTGRRGVIAAMFAALLAAALFERNQPEAAEALLADRLDVIERSGMPDAVLCAFQTLARIALARNDERQALHLLEHLHALGEAREMPRMCVVSLTEQVRLHALRARTETVTTLLAAVDLLEPSFEAVPFRPFLPQYRLVRAIARTYAALAKFDLDTAETEIRSAHTLATELRRGYDALAVKVLRAVILEQRARGTGLPLLVEAQGLAAIGGLDRLLAEVHPDALQAGTTNAPAPAQAPPPPAAPAAPRATTVVGGLLTPKEAEVLKLLAAGLSNKLIARTMDISDETVKWHLKNLFAKLSAGTRKHVVDRARMLGLVDA